MEPFLIQIFVFLLILSLTLTVYVHAKEEIEREGDSIITHNLNAEKSKSSESKSRVVRQYEDVENRRQLARDLRIQREARRNLEVQVKQMQEKLNSVVDFKNEIEDATQNYRNLSSSVTSIFMMRGLRGLTNNVSDLTTKVSFLDNNLMRVQNEMKDSINSSYVSQLTKTLQDTKNLEKSGYQTIKLEISPNVREMKDKADMCESIHSQQYVPCKEGWFLYSEKCYKMFLDKKSWMEASRKCTREGGRLATVSSHELQEFVNTFFILNERITAWIGLNDRNTETVFVWDDGSPVGFTNWDYDQPDGKGFSSNEDCVEIRLGVRPRVNSRELGYWNDLDCNYKMPYICQVDKNKGMKNISPDPRFCSLNEGGGFKYRESCFNIIRTKKSWEEAEKHCEENFNGHLMTILDTEVETFLNYILSNINEDFWIGIRGKDKVAQKWISGWPVAHNRLNLDMRQFPTGTCVLRSKDNLWTTAECFREFPFICETTKIKAPVLKKAPEGWQCPDTSKDWVDFGGESCYIIGTNRFLKWYEANYECGRKGGTLASITSEEEAMILQYFVIDHSPVFIGLHRSFSNTHLFEWADGSNMEYANWGPGEPNSDKEDCVEMFSRYLVLYNVWNDIDCYGPTDRLYICSAKKVPSSTTELTTSSIGGCVCRVPSSTTELTSSNSGDCVCPEESSFIKKTLERFPCPHLSAEWQDVEGDYCYIFVTNKSISWDKAHYECGRKGGILASIHSKEQTNVLQQYVKHSAQSVYIGLHRSLSNKNVFEWADGSKVDFQPWRPSEPSDISEECVALVPESMKWNDINCNSLNGYICAAKKYKADVSENKYSQPYVPCKEHWFLYGEKCYKFFRESKEWNESSENCSEEGGHLATVSSSEVKEFINAFLLLNGRSNAWIGLNDIEIQSNFTWRDGSNFSYTNWRPGEPSGKNSHAKKENCVETIFGNPYVSSPHKLGYWNDVSCDVKMPYICQMDKSKGVKTLSPDPRFCSINEGGGFKYLESCYHIVRTKKSWEEAEKHCEKNFSGHLVKILDKEVEIFLNYILSNVTKDFWIGIRRQDKTIQKWSSGWHVVHNRLNDDLKEFPTGTCVLRSKKLLWTTADCSLEFPFICERTKIQAPILRKAPEGWQCPKKSTEWLDLEGESCYIFGTNKTLNWYGSNYECARKGGILASITSKEEEMVLQHYVITHREVFIGLHRSLSNKQMFEWADGSRMEYTSWEPNEPNNEKEECGELYSNTNTWNDIDCDRTKDRTYICSVKKVPPSTTESTTSKPSDCVCPNGTEIIMNVSKGLHCPDLSETWVDVDGDYCYIFVTNNSLRWNEAHYECGRKGGVLASIHSVQQTNMLRPYLQNSAQSVYIGLHRSSLNSDVFEWADGTEMDYQNWSLSRTRVGRGAASSLSEIGLSANSKQDCVVMDTKSMKWNHINCRTPKEYICASKKVPSSKIGTTTSASSDCVCSYPSNP